MPPACKAHGTAGGVGIPTSTFVLGRQSVRRPRRQCCTSLDPLCSLPRRDDWSVVIRDIGQNNVCEYRRIRAATNPRLVSYLAASLPLRAAAPRHTMGPLRRNASGGLRNCSTGNGSGRTRPRPGLRWWFMRCPPQRPRAGRSGSSGPGEWANATGPPATPP